MGSMRATNLRDRTHRRSRITDGADFVHHTRQLLRRISGLPPSEYAQRIGRGGTRARIRAGDQT
jgi:hypothetical protein